MLHSLAIILTLIVGVLIVWQWLGRKGTWWHAVRGISTGVSAAALVVIVMVLTMASQAGVVWSYQLKIHIGIGTAFFIALFTACWYGWVNYQRKKKHAVAYTKDVQLHHRWVIITTVLLALTLASAFVAASARRADQKRHVATTTSVAK